MSRHAPSLAAAFLAIAGSLLVATRAGAFSSGPPDGFAGEPPFYRSCTTCHGNGMPGDGAFALLNVPSEYEPNQTYGLMVELRDPGQIRWGFELTVIDDVMFNQAGTLIVTDPVATQLSDNPNQTPDYLKHTLEGTYAGVPDGPVTWSFQWTAPASGSVSFYAAGNAANGDGNADDGDVIYLVSVPVGSALAVDAGSPSPVPAARLEPSFPNPFGPATSIPFELAEAGPVRLRVYGADGRLIADLLDGERPAGRHVVIWDGRDGRGGRAPSGIYFLVLRAGGIESQQRVLVE